MKVSVFVLLGLLVAEVGQCCSVPSGSNISVVPTKSTGVTMTGPYENPSSTLYLNVDRETLKWPGEEVMLIRVELEISVRYAF